MIALAVWIPWCILMEWLAYRSKRKQRGKWLMREAAGLVISFAIAMLAGYFWGD